MPARSDDEPSMAVELVSFSQGAEDFLVYTPLDPLVFLAAQAPNNGPWQALLGLDEEGEPGLTEALEELNAELQALAREI